MPTPSRRHRSRTVIGWSIAGLLVLQAGAVEALAAPAPSLTTAAVSLPITTPDASWHEHAARRAAQTAGVSRRPADPVRPGHRRPAGRRTVAVAAPAGAPTTAPRTPAPPAAVPAPAPAAAVPAAPPAPAADLCTGPDFRQRRGQAALDSLRPSPSAGFAISFVGDSPGYLGMTYPHEHRIDVFVRSCAGEDAALLRHVVAHELGHAWDTSQLEDAQRAAYLAARGIAPGTPWFGCNRCADLATPAGDFAEVYGQWRRGGTGNLSQVGSAPGPAELTSLAARFFGG